LIQCLEKCGFNEKWCAWVKKVMEQGTVVVKIITGSLFYEL
jgi:hypothetical protein